MKEELPESCKICLGLTMKSSNTVGMGSIFEPQVLEDKSLRSCGKYGTSYCLPKDRALIVLLDKLLKRGY